MKGMDTFKMNMQLVSKTISKSVAAALYTEAVIVEQTSRERTPVSTGALRASHETSLPVMGEGQIDIQIRVGGPAAPYAIPVHEKVEVYHKVGQAKFLESAILESAPTLAARIARRVKLEG